MQTPLFNFFGINEKVFWSEVNKLPEIYSLRNQTVSAETIYLNHILSYVKNRSESKNPKVQQDVYKQKDPQISNKTVAESINLETSNDEIIEMSRMGKLVSKTLFFPRQLQRSSKRSVSGPYHASYDFRSHNYPFNVFL